MLYKNTFINIKKVLGHSDDTILYRYCKEAIESYTEPKKLGVKKGDIIGFSFQKNAACVFLAVTNLQLKIISERSGLSNASIRTWNTQKAFKIEKEKKCLRFVDIIKKTQENTVVDDVRDRHLYLGDKFKDKYLYSDCVIRNLPPVLDFGAVCLILSGHTISRKGKATTKEAIISEIDRYMHLISKGVLSNREKEKLKNLLSMTKSYLTTK